MWGLLIGNHAAAKADPESFFSNYKQIFHFIHLIGKRIIIKRIRTIRSIK